MSPDEAILILDSIPPIRAQKAYYYTEPLFIKRLKAVSPSLRSIPDATLCQGDFEAAARSDLRLWFRPIAPFNRGIMTAHPPAPSFPSDDLKTEKGDGVERTEEISAKRRFPQRRKRLLETDPEQLEIKLR